MNDKEWERLHSILTEHFQSYLIVGFDLDGEKWRVCNHQTDVQAYALAAAMRQEANSNISAPEVWVRNFPKVGGDEE